MQNKKHIIDDPPEGEGASDPMDIWLKQQLGGLHADMLSDTLPDELGKLAAALEARLRGKPVPSGTIGDEAGPKPDSEPGNGA